MLVLGQQLLLDAVLNWLSKQLDLVRFAESVYPQSVELCQ
jgi:hypothetical protein